MPIVLFTRKILLPMGISFIVASLLAVITETFAPGHPLGHGHSLKHKSMAETLLALKRSPMQLTPAQYKKEEKPGYLYVGRRDTSNYTIEAGDTLSSIAVTYSITDDFLSLFNPGVNWQDLPLGLPISMPSLRTPLSYTIVSGDTGNAIAAKYNISFPDLAAAAPSVNWNLLQIGQVLQVPGYGTPTTYNPVVGDTGYSISAGFQITFSCLLSANTDVDWFNLQPGSTVLQIPAGPSPTDCNCAVNSTNTTGSSVTATMTISANILTTTSSVGSSAQAPGSVASTPSAPTSALITSSNLSSDTGLSGSATQSPTFVTQTPSAPISGSQDLTSAPSTTSSLSTSQPLLTATGVVVGTNAVLKPNNQDGQSSSPPYTVYRGDGKTWPQLSEWVSFDSMWANVQSTLGQNCADGVTSNTPDETQQLYNAIQYVSESSHVDDRFILAIVESESNGCVRVPTTTWSVANPGLMQSHAGSGTCNQNGVLNPCPYYMIVQMIQDGTMGTASGDGLAQLINQVGDLTGAVAFYMAARMYNSGSIPADRNLGGPGATPCYASDIANRLMGWNGIGTKCQSDDGVGVK